MPFNKQGVFYREAWHMDKLYNQKAKEEGRGPKIWHYDYSMSITRLGERIFQLQGFKPIKIPDFDERSKERIFIIKKLSSGVISQIKQKKLDTRLLADPETMTVKELQKFKGSWIDLNDLKLSSRLVEFLGIISNNKGITKRQLQVFYNTTAFNIQRMIILATSYGVSFTSSSKLKIKYYGVFNKEVIDALYLETDGLDAVLSEIIVAVDSIKENGTIDTVKANMLAYEYWKKREAQLQEKQLGE